MLPDHLKSPPNPLIRRLTDDQVLEEYHYWQGKLSEKTAWGSSLSAMQGCRDKCEGEMKRRGLIGGAPTRKE